MRARRSGWNAIPFGVASIASLLVGLLLAGCGKTMGEDDCKAVGAHMRDVWNTERQKAAPTEGVPSDKADAVVKGEGEKLVADWMAECKKELQGRKVDPKEMDCLMKAGTVDDVRKCAE